MLNSEQMLPGRIRNMRQMKDLLDAEDLVLAEIERIIEDMYRRESMLHEELVNEAWLERRLYELTSAKTEVRGNADALLVFVQLDVSELKDLDLQAVRLFLDKWLPAHLMYKLGYLFAYPVELQERVCISRLGFHMSFSFWQMRVLNGEWLLDGSVNLGQRPRWKMGVGIVQGAVQLTGKELVSSSGIGSSMRFQDIKERYGLGLKVNAAVSLDGTWSAVGNKVKTTVPVLEQEAAESETVTIKKDLWYLDGTVLLDGSRLLDAEIREERL